MAYLESERSQHGGKPVELYKFEGTYANFFYTSGPKKVRFPDNPQGDTYLPIAMQRSEITVGTQDDDGIDLSVTMSVQNEIVKVYGFQNSPPSLTLEIIRFHELASPKTIWTGPVNDIQVSNGIATIRSPSTLAAAMSQNFPNVFFQAPCNNVLYDRRCKVPFGDWSVATKIAAINGRTITVASVGTLGGKLIGGEVALASGERRMIVSQENAAIVVNFPFSKAMVNDNVTIAAGCNLDYNGDCALKFANQKNFGGFPFIPADNPFESGIDPSIVPLPDNTCIPDISGSWYVQLTWGQPTLLGRYPNVYAGQLPQPSPLFPNGGFVKQGAFFSRGNASPNPDNGNFVLVDVEGGFDVRDYGSNGAIIYQFRWIFVGGRVQGYRWDFNFELENNGIYWSHQFSHDAFDSGGYPALIEVGTGTKVIATKNDFVGRLFPYGYGINY